METINNYTTSSARLFFFLGGGEQNGTFAIFCAVFSLVAVTSQYLEHPWAVKILLLVFLGNIAMVLPKVNM